MSEDQREARKRRKERISNIKVAQILPLQHPSLDPDDPPPANILADQYFEFLRHKIVLDSQLISNAQERIEKDSTLKNKINRHREGMLEEIVKAITTYEQLIIYESDIALHNVFNDIKACQLSEIDVQTIRKNYGYLDEATIKAFRSNIRPQMSRQQKCLILATLHEYPLLRLFSKDLSCYENGAPKRTFRNTLLIIVFRIIKDYATTSIQKKRGACLDLTVDVISTIKPTLNTNNDLSAKTVINALSLK